MRLTALRALYRLVSVILMVSALLGATFFAGVWAQSPSAPDESTEELRTDIARIAELFYARQFDAVVREAGPLLARHGLTPISFSIGRPNAANAAPLDPELRRVTRRYARPIL
jgi:hypothetical protein